MTHQELSDLAASYALDALDGEERAAVEAHLAGCEACRAEVASYREVTTLLALAVPPSPPPDALAVRERLLARVRQEQPPAPAARAPARVLPATRARRPWATYAGWMAAAASLAFAVATGAAYRRERAERARLVSALATARAEIALRDSTVAAFLGPEVHVVSLSVADRKPSMRVFWNHTRDVFIITAHDLPKAPPGKTYQLWAMAKGKAPVSMGTFDTDAGGRAALIVPVGDGIEEAGFIDDCALTLEPLGGSPQPTEAPRLIGTWRHVD
jgi:anti-sigma-K factor RskA